jgi:hypothetical protein
VKQPEVIGSENGKRKAASAFENGSASRRS